jgi:16S rRNA (cytosine1402-N4)-methyltransferase
MTEPHALTTPAISHRPMMLDEVLEHLRPRPGEIAVDCTLGGGGHAQAILERLQPGGRLLGLEIDALELPRTEARLRAAGFTSDVFAARHASFADLPQVLARERIAAADVMLADLGVSSMQMENAARGFNYKVPGPLDMRMDPSRGVSASQLIAGATEEEIARVLVDNADEPHAALIARLLKQQPLTTTHAAERIVRMGLNRELPALPKADVKMSVRRTFQALRIAVNDELSSLDALLRVVPQCLAPGGRIVVITFHSGEDRRVKKAFQSGQRDGVFSAVAKEVVRSKKDETYADRRAMAAKLRWAVRA